MEKQNYLQLSSKISNEEQRELCVYVLGEAGFSSFEEEGDELKAYIEDDKWDEAMVNEMLAAYFPEETPTYTLTHIAAVNWNEEWEKNYPNVYLDGFCQVLPSFRTPLEGFPYTLIIDPKMSFGTGHHATTQSVMWLMKDMDFVGKKVMDMGCGTSLLGILAAKMGSNDVLCVDIDPWCVENSIENIAKNEVTIPCILGGAETIPENEMYDVFIANINRHILLADGETYIQHLKKDGILLLSGFYQEDVPIIEAHFHPLGLQTVASATEKNWVALKMIAS